MTDNNILLVCEAGAGQTEAANARLIALGAGLCEKWGGRLTCLLAGHGIEAAAAELSRHVDDVRVADSALHANYHPEARLALVRKLVDELKPRVVLFGHTFMGMDLAPRLAAKLGVSVASNCFDIQVEGDAVTFMRPMYRGRVHARVVLECNPMIATVQQSGAMAPAATRSGTVSAIEAAADGAGRIRPLRTIEPARTGVDITKADIVVSGGRGVGEKENFALINNLAEALGGVPACSRPLVDMGWFGSNYQVGLSGNTVKPKLYVACGISGAVEHLHGMKESGTIVAINKDAEAPIFKVAHFGLVGDLNEIVPQLTREVGAAKISRKN
jgi:electron transfer flavoprotein alpha subunit